MSMSVRPFVAGVALWIISGLAGAEGMPRPDALLMVDQHREAIVERVVKAWPETLTGEQADVLRRTLSGLRADRLLAISISPGVTSLVAVLDGVDKADATASALKPTTKALGDVNADLTYNPVTPCRIVDTRSGAGGILIAGDTRNWLAANPSGTFAAQGGSSTNCGIPVKPAAVLVNLTVANTGAGPAFLVGWPYNQPKPTAASLNWVAAGTQLANAIILPLCTGGGCTADWSLFASGGTDLIVDVMGYFSAPASGYVTSVAGGAGVNVTGTTAPTVSLLATQLLPSAACAANQVPKWNGTSWVCAADLDTNSGGTVTSVSAGSGLTGGTITTSGTVAIASGGVTAAMLASNGCTNGQVLKWTGAAWTCAIDVVGTGTVTSVTAAPAGGLATTPPGGIVDSGSIGVATGGIATAMLADGAVTSAKIASGSVTADKLATDQKLPACTIGQAARWTGSAWICGNLPPSLLNLGETGYYPSVALGADGLPVVAFYSSPDNRLNLLKCGDPSCIGPTATSIVDTNVSGSGRIGLVVGADGFPIISYTTSNTNLLRVAKCLNSSCSGGAVFLATIDSTSQAYSPSIALGSDAVPIISYSFAGGGLKVAKCATALCAGPATITVVDGASNVGYGSSIKVPSDGLPIISYADGSSQRVKLAKCADTACTSSSLRVLDASGIGQTSLAIGSDGFAFVVYAVNGGGFRLARCIDATCSGASYRLLDPNYGDGTVYVGSDTLPFVAYTSNGMVRAVKCSDSICTGPLTFGVVESQGPASGPASAVVASDTLPAIAYSMGSQVRFGKCQNAVCAYP